MANALRIIFATLLLLTHGTRAAEEVAGVGGTYQPGLVQTIYQLQVRPKRIRESLLGMPAAKVRVAAGPVIRTDDDLAGLAGNVQAEFAGEIFIPTDGEYAFAAESDDGMDLRIDGKSVLTNAWVNGNNVPSTATVTLTKGWTPIRVRFYQGDGGFGLSVRWRPPGATAESPIPTGNLRVAETDIAAAKNRLTVDETAEAADANSKHRFVFRSMGFHELPESDADLLVEILEGPTGYSRGARKDFASLVGNTNYRKLPPWHQVMVLSGFLRGWHVEYMGRGAVKHRAAYTLSDPRACEYDGWHGAKRTGFETTITIGDQRFTVYTPAADSIERESVAMGIASLPKALRGMLKRVRVEPYGTASEFNGGGDEIWIRRKEATPASMVEDTFAHEIGHILMNRADCYAAWKDAVADDVLSVSHYGRLNPSEDFAEFVRLYLSSEGDGAQVKSLRKMFPRRMEVLDDALATVEFGWVSDGGDGASDGARRHAVMK